MPEVSEAKWTEWLRGHPQSHFLQTREWGELKARHGWQVVRLIVGASGAQILFRPLPLGLSLAYIPKVARAQIATADEAEFWQSVRSVCSHRGAIVCKLEPDVWEGLDEGWRPDGFSPSAHEIQPRRTLVVDLRPDEDAVLAQMKQKCRYNIRLAHKKGVSVRPWNDIEGFHRLLEATGRRDNFGVHSTDYYQDAHALFSPVGGAELLLAHADDTPVAALMVFARGERAWYVYGGSSELHREKMPSYLLQWEAMRWAKSRGCTAYDLWGVPDADHEALETQFESRNDGLWGVYRFKRGFGGQLRRAQPTLDLILQPILYRMYILAASRRMAM